jgi:hypothetical protein
MGNQLLWTLKRALVAYWLVHDDQSRLEQAIQIREADAVNTCQRELIDLLQAEAEARTSTQTARSTLHTAIDNCTKNLDRVRNTIEKEWNPSSSSSSASSSSSSSTTTTVTASTSSSIGTEFPEGMMSSLLALYDSTEELTNSETIHLGPEETNLLSGNNLRAGTIPLLSGLRSATVDELIELMTSDLCEYHVQLQKVFLMTYRYFVSFQLLLQKLVMRYCIAPAAPLAFEVDEAPDGEELQSWATAQLSTRHRVLGMLHMWINEYYNVDFVDSRNRAMLLAFLSNTVVHTGFESKGRELMELISSKQQELMLATPPPPPPPPQVGGTSTSTGDSCSLSPPTTATATATTPPTLVLSSPPSSPPMAEQVLSSTINSPPAIHRMLSASSIAAASSNVGAVCDISVLSMTPGDFAKCLTYTEFKMSQSLRWNEFVELRWSKANKDLLAPHITQNTQHFNRIGLWVIHSIVSEADLTVRAMILRRFIIVALHLYKLNNFQGVMEILAGLQATPVSRLRRTWQTVGWDMFVLKQTLHLLFHSNYIFLRREIAHVGLPCIPYLGMYLKDLTFTEDGNPNMVDEGQVNFWKFQRIYTTITEILQFQKSSYDDLLQSTAALGTSMAHFGAQLVQLPTVEYDDAYQLSLRLEPNSDIQQLPKFNYDLLEQLNHNEDAALAKLRSLRSHPLLLRRETAVPSGGGFVSMESTTNLLAYLSSSPPLNAVSPIGDACDADGNQAAVHRNISSSSLTSLSATNAINATTASGSSPTLASMLGAYGSSSNLLLAANNAYQATNAGGAAGSLHTSASPSNTGAPNASNSTVAFDNDYIIEVHMCMRNPHTGLKLKNRKYMLRNYPNCFTGAEAMAWIRENLNVSGTADAEQVGNALLSLGLVRALSGDDKFRDKKNSFFTFVEVNPFNW